MVAVNCWVAPANTNAVPGETEAVLVTVMAEVALLAVSTTLVAITVWLPAWDGAVYNPAAAMVPTLEFPPVTESTDHATAVFEVPCTVAVNCACPPTGRLTDDWLSVTLTSGGVGVGVGVGVDLPPQPTSARVIAKVTQRPEILDEVPFIVCSAARKNQAIDGVGNERVAGRWARPFGITGQRDGTGSELPCSPCETYSIYFRSIAGARLAARSCQQSGRILGVIGEDNT